MSKDSFLRDQTLTAAIVLNAPGKLLAKKLGNNISCLFKDPHPLRHCGPSFTIEMELFGWLENLYNLTLRFVQASTYGVNDTKTKNEDSIWELLKRGKADISGNPMSMSGVSVLVL